MNIKEFLKLSSEKQKEYVLGLDTNEFNKFNAIVKKKNFKLAMILSSHIQSNKNMMNKLKNEEQKKIDIPNSLDIFSILDNPAQPRKFFTNDDIKEKMLSIKSRGLLTPITVYKNNKSEYVLIAGQLRLEAFKRLNQEEKSLNIKTEDMKYNNIEVYVKNNEDYNDDDFAVDSLSENIIRTDMNVIDTAKSIKKVFDAQNESLGEFSKKLGKSKFYISSYLAISNTDEEFLNYLSEKNFSSPTIIYLIIQMDKTIEEKKKILDKYINGDIKKNDLTLMRKEEGKVKSRISKKENIDILDNIFSFKKSFSVTKYKKLNEDKKLIVDKKLEEIKRLQEDINSFF